jgi:hypothetical protein
MSYQVS